MYLTNGQLEDSTNYKGSGGSDNFHRLSYTKAERLCNEKIIASLFTAGQSFLIHPLRVVYMNAMPGSIFPASIVFSVSKRNFPKAADRNRIKRLLREAYRLNKPTLYEQLRNKNAGLHIMIIYTARTITTFNGMESKMKLVLKRLTEDDAATA